MWFKRKKYGWGWTPTSWQGWAVTLIYGFSIGFYVGWTHSMKNFSPKVFGILCVVTTMAFLAIAFKKGPKPKWQWGKEKP